MSRSHFVVLFIDYTSLAVDRTQLALIEGLDYIGLSKGTGSQVVVTIGKEQFILVGTIEEVMQKVLKTSFKEHRYKTYLIGTTNEFGPRVIEFIRQKIGKRKGFLIHSIDELIELLT